MVRLEKYILDLINSGGILHLDTSNPNWDNARGYFFDQDKQLLFFKVSKEFLKDRDVNKYQIRIGHNQKYLLIKGVLSEAKEDEDMRKWLSHLIEKLEWSEENARYSLYDKRNGKSRKNNYKLSISKVLNFL